VTHDGDPLRGKLYAQVRLNQIADQFSLDIHQYEDAEDLLKRLLRGEADAKPYIINELIAEHVRVVADYYLKPA
jgi:hypothetical protein